MIRLTVELVPSTAFFKNLRAILSKAEWDKLRKATYANAWYKCEICEGKGPAHPVECHEQWDYDDKKHTMTLTGLIALCPACHRVKHFGFAEMRGYGDMALAHLCKINGWSRTEGEEYLFKASNEWQRRSEYEWKINIDWIDDKV